VIRNILHLAAALSASASIATVAGAQSSSADSAAAVAVTQRFHQALAASDSTLAVSLLADDVLVLESGAIQNRADYLSHHLGADMKASHDSRGVRTVVRVTVVGSLAYVASSTLTPSTGAEGNNGSELAELMIVSRGATGWKIRAVHWSSRRRRP